MRLEMAEFPVRRIRLGAATRYQDGVLDVDGEALTRLVLRDARIESAQFEIVAPGEPVRVTGIRDVVEPRAKFGDDGQVFPGVIVPISVPETLALVGLESSAVTVSAAELRSEATVY